MNERFKKGRGPSRSTYRLTKLQKANQREREGPAAKNRRQKDKRNVGITATYGKGIPMVTERLSQTKTAAACQNNAGENLAQKGKMRNYSRQFLWLASEGGQN